MRNSKHQIAALLQAEVFRHYLAMLSGSAGKLIASLIYFVALANSLSISEFGVFATASGAGVVLSRLVALGFNSPLYRISAVKPRLLGAYTAGYILIALLSLPLLFIAAALFFYLFFNSNISILAFTLIIVAEALIWRSTEIIIIVNNGLNKFALGAALSVVGIITRAVAAVLFMFVSAHTLNDWAWWYIAANLVAFIIALKFYPKVRLRIKSPLYYRHISDSLSVTGAEFLFYLQTELDKLMVLSFGGPAIAGIYAVLIRLIDLTAIPIRSFNMLLVQKMMRQPNWLHSIKLRISLEAGIFLISTLGLCALAVILYFFPRILGSNIMPVAALLPLTLAIPGFRNLIEYQNELLYARGQTLLRAINLAAIAALKTLLLWLLLRNYNGGDGWVYELNFVFGAIYLLSLVFTYASMRRPAKRV